MRAATLATLLLAIGATAAEPDLEVQVARLAGAQPYDAYRVLSARNDERMVAAIGRVLPGCGDLGQYYGIMLIRRYPPKVTRPVLRSLAQKKAPYLRVAAGAELVRMGDRGAAAAVARALRTEGVADPIRVRMVSGLFNLRAPEIEEALKEFLDPGRSPTVVGATLQYFHQKKDRSVLPACKQLLRQSNPGVTAMAAAYLLAHGERGHAKELAESLESGRLDAGSFSRVRYLLGDVRLPGRVLEALVQFMATKPSAYTLRAALELLEKHQYEKALPAIRKLLDDPNSQVAKAAFEALAGWPGALEQQRLQAILTGPDPQRRAWAADALRRMDDLSGLPAVLDLLKTGATTQQRRDAARMLGGFRVAAAVEPLLAALDDRDPTTRTYARTALGQVLRTLFPYRRLDLRGATPRQLRRWWIANRERGW